MPDGLVFALILIAFPFGFYWFWKAIVVLIAHIGGWKTLAETFATEEPAHGQVFTMVSAQFGLFTNYSHSLNLSISADGLHLSPIIFFRTGHRPLFIPWEAIGELNSSQSRFFSSAQLQIQHGDGAKSISIRIFGQALVNSLMEQAPSRLVQK